MLALIVDGLIIVLLLVVLVGGLTLHRRLVRLRGPEGELQQLIEGLDNATARAEAVLAGFSREAAESKGAIAGERERLVSLIDDLRLLTERADREADRLADLISAARSGAPAAARPATHETSADGGVHDQALLEKALRSLR